MINSHSLPNPKCTECQKPIREKALMAEGKVYHPNHFQCNNCDKVLSGAYVLKDHQILCTDCHSNLNIVICTRCYKPIEGKYYMIQNEKCHLACFTCVTCQKPFDDGVFYPVDNRVYCLEHHWGAKSINSGGN